MFLSEEYFPYYKEFIDKNDYPVEKEMLYRAFNEDLRIIDRGTNLEEMIKARIILFAISDDVLEKLERMLADTKNQKELKKINRAAIAIRIKVHNRTSYCSKYSQKYEGVKKLCEYLKSKK